jgi:hypothetical protein
LDNDPTHFFISCTLCNNVILHNLIESKTLYIINLGI